MCNLANWFRLKFASMEFLPLPPPPPPPPAHLPFLSLFSLSLSLSLSLLLYECIRMYVYMCGRSGIHACVCGWVGKGGGMSVCVREGLPQVRGSSLLYLFVLSVCRSVCLSVCLFSFVRCLFVVVDFYHRKTYSAARKFRRHRVLWHFSDSSENNWNVIK